MRNPITGEEDEDDESFPDPEEVASRRVGTLFAGKWKIERVLGSGGMATVYAATHTNNQRTAALKVLHTELTINGDFKKRFLREGLIANRVGHPGAVAVLDDGEDDDGNVFLVMELLAGASLADRIRTARDKNPADAPRRGVDQAEALRIADGVLDVLIAAHAQGILHRDLKPDNVFVTDVGAVKVLDFGIARLREPQSGDTDAMKSRTQTRTGVVLGTPQYMAPEQARGRSNEVDERSDLWAVGAIVFAMLTGRHVHEAETPNEALLKAMTAIAQPLEALVPEVDPKVSAIVDRALAFERDSRYPNARAMQTDVRAAMARLGPGRADLLPTSNGAEALSPRAVTSVTRSALAMAGEPGGARSSGWRVFSVVAVIAVCAVGGREILLHLSPHAAATPNPAAIATPDVPDAATRTSRIAAAAPSIASGAPDAAAPLAEAANAPVDLDAGLDAGIVDVDADDEDDDGGDDEEEISVEPAAPATPVVAGHPAAHSTAPARHPIAAPAKVDPKKRHKKKKKH